MELYNKTILHTFKDQDNIEFCLMQLLIFKILYIPINKAIIDFQTQISRKIRHFFNVYSHYLIKTGFY